MQNARPSTVHRRGVAIRHFQSVAAGFDAVNLHLPVVEEIVEQAHRVRAAADAGDQRVGQPSFALQHLLAHFPADDRLEIAHHRRIGMRPGHRADDVEGVLDIRHPVAQRVVHGVLERAVARRDRHHLRAQQLHAEDVRLLPLDVGRAHIDDARQAEARRDRRHGDAMLAGAGLGDDAGLAHAAGELDLAEAIVDLVRAGMVQLVALEIDLGAAETLGQPLGEIERAGAAGIMGVELVQLGLEARIALGGLIGRLPAPGSAASAFRRRNARHKGRNGRSRRDRCGSCSAPACARIIHWRSLPKPASSACLDEFGGSARHPLRRAPFRRPEDTSTIAAPVSAMASATLPAFRPPDSMKRILPRSGASRRQSKASPLPPGSAPAYRAVAWRRTG